MDRRAPSRVDPVLRVLSAAVGGPAGERSAGHRWWGPARVLLALTTATLLLGMAGRSACVRRGWSGEQPFAELCWTELAGTSASRTSAGAPASYVAGLAQRLGGLVAPDAAPGLAVAAVLAVVLAGVALGVTGLLATAPSSPPWAAAGWAAAPVLAAHWLSWDLLVAAGLVLVLLARVYRRPWPAIVGVLLVGAFGHPLVDTRTPDTGSLWLLVGQAGGAPGTLVRSAVLVGAVVAAYGLARSLPRAPGRDVAGAARVGLLVVGTVLLVGPSAPPEAALVLLPLAALAVPRWCDLLVWQGCELLAWVVTGWHLGGALVPSTGGESQMSWLATLLRVAGVCWLLVAALRSGSGDQDAVEDRRGEPHPHVDLVADLGHAGA